ncbi:hypothetical protein AVEN_39881-1 [Araneus ventricosus]|uniref:Uncharacterized protein n=1 Tax=Araneus ventricosus TaxID=182803 RepID=A0A4Y2WE00_ARAVE|nr:hypothetical protein AVEN_39881-1 [Araneus ventricosus]
MRQSTIINREINDFSPTPRRNASVPDRGLREKAIKVEKSRHVIHLKLQSALAVEESDLLSPSTAALRSPSISPTQRISDKVTASRGPNLVKSFDVCADYPR